MLRKIAIGFGVTCLGAVAVFISHATCTFGCAQFDGSGSSLRSPFGVNGMMNWRNYEFAFGGDIIASTLVIVLIGAILVKQRRKRASRVWEDE